MTNHDSWGGIFFVKLLLIFIRNASIECIFINVINAQLRVPYKCGHSSSDNLDIIWITYIPIIFHKYLDTQFLDSKHAEHIYT